MPKKKISRKQALRQMGGLALGSQMLTPLGAFSKEEVKISKPQKESSPAKNHKQPHIILIMTDQQRADALGCAGNPSILTPNIDQLANEGALFKQTYSSTPSCTPARSCLLTGMNPWKNGMLGYGRMGRKYKYEMPRMMKDGGYYTFCVGKNHWYPQKSLKGFNGTLVDESGRIEQDGFISDYRDWFKLEAPGEDPDKTGIGWNSRLAAPYALDEQLHPTSWIGNTARDFIEKYDVDAPLFLKISFERPHSPYDPPQSVLDRYKDIEVSGPAIGDWEGSIYNYPDTDKPIPTTGPPSAAFGDFGEKQVKTSKKHYYANISFIDDQVGKIVQQLKDREMYEHSLICFISDHGDEMGDHYHWRKTFPYQGSVHIPFILKWPTTFHSKVKRGESLENPMGLQDILPTLLAASGQAIPDDMDGKSALDLLRDKDSNWREYIGMEHSSSYFYNNYWAGVTDGKRKFIWHFRIGQEQFFDLEKDPHEKTELSHKASRKNEIQTYREKLIAYLDERGSEFVKDGQLVKRKESMVYSPHFPEAKEDLGYWKKQERKSFTLEEKS